ncbi:MAG: MFS transporter [Gemmatimonadetes bacterium]|nr:MFS transporter [Gemmatimonadota bacterium]
MKPNRPPALLPLMLLLELVALGATFPVIAYFVRELGGTAFHITLCFFFTAAPKIFLQPIWGDWSDKIGRKPILAAGILGSIIGYAGWAYAPSLGWFLVARAVVGLFGTQLTVATAIIADTMKPEDRAKGLGVLGATAGLGFILGPLAGGLIASADTLVELKQFVGLTSYAFVGAFNLALEGGALLIALLLPETAPKVATHLRRRTNSLRLWRQAFAHQGVGLILISTLVGSTGTSVLQGTLVILAADRWGFAVGQTGKALALYFLISALVQGGAIRYLVPKLGELFLAQWGTFLAAIGIALLVPNLPVLWLWVALTVIAIGASLNTPSLTALLSRYTHIGDQGKVQGLNQGVTGLGRSISGISMGWLYDAFGPFMPFAISAILTFAGFAILLPIDPKHRYETFHSQHPADEEES